MSSKGIIFRRIGGRIVPVIRRENVSIMLKNYPERHARNAMADVEMIRKNRHLSKIKEKVVKNISDPNILSNHEKRKFEQQRKIVTSRVNEYFKKLGVKKKVKGIK